MARTTFHGRLDTADPGAVAALVRPWVGQPDLTMTVHRQGYELTFTDAAVDLYCYEVHGPRGDPFFLFEGVFELAPAAARPRFMELVDAARAVGVTATIDYAEANEDGDEIGAELTAP